MSPRCTRAVGILPVVAGKPETPIFDEAKARFGASNPVFIGDRLDTDILGANRAGMTSIMVLTGIDGAKQVLAAAPDSRPHFLLDDLRGLSEPYPTIEAGQDADGSIDHESRRCDRAPCERRNSPSSTRETAGSTCCALALPRSGRAASPSTRSTLPPNYILEP